MAICSSCGHTSGVVTNDSQSYVRFAGDFKGTVVYIDDNAPIMLGKSSSADHSDGLGSKKRSIHYELSPGRHTIVIKKDGRVIVEREVFIDSTITKEIQVP